MVGGDFTLHWIGSGPIAPIVERHGLKVGSLLYAAPQSGWLPISEAPRDGSYVLLASERDQDIASGYWLQSAYNGVGAWIWPFVHKNPVRYIPLPPSTKGESTNG